MLEPFLLLSLAVAHAELGHLKEARRCVDEAMTRIEMTKDKWYEAEVNRVAGEIALKSPDPDAVESAGIFRAGPCYRAGAGGEIPGTVLSRKHGPALARPRQEGGRSRFTRSYLRLVYRGLPYAPVAER
jgi:hypothetical protein